EPGARRGTPTRSRHRRALAAAGSCMVPALDLSNLPKEAAMTRRIAVALLSLGMMATPARAADSSAERARGALGYRATAAPVGLRWWFSQHKFGLDLGAGFDTHKDANSGDSLNGWRIDAGLPWALKSWDRVDVILRPG